MPPINFKRFTGLLAVVLAYGVATHAQEANKRVKVIGPRGDGKVVEAKIGSDGAVHLLIQSDAGPGYIKSTDNGVTFTSPMMIVDPASQKRGLEFQGEDLAIGKDGRVFVAMSNNAWKLKLPVEEWSFYLATLDHGGKAFGRTRNLNLKPSEGFSIAADKNGAVAASFLSDKLFVKLSRDNGQTFSPNAEPNADWNPCNCCTTSAAFGPDGRLAVLYREETNNERDMYVALIDPNGAIAPVRKRVSTTPWKIEGCPMTYYNISATDFGYVATWPTKDQVYFARLDKNGSVMAPGEIKTPGAHGMRTHLVAVAAGDGASLVAWKKDNVLGWQVYDAEGHAVGKSESADSSGNGAAVVALPNGNFLVFL
jgi:hypothetical protein